MQNPPDRPHGPGPCRWAGLPNSAHTAEQADGVTNHSPIDTKISQAYKTHSGCTALCVNMDHYPRIHADGASGESQSTYYMTFDIHKYKSPTLLGNCRHSPVDSGSSFPSL